MLTIPVGCFFFYLEQEHSLNHIYLFTISDPGSILLSKKLLSHQLKQMAVFETTADILQHIYQLFFVSESALKDGAAPWPPRGQSVIFVNESAFLYSGGSLIKGPGHLPADIKALRQVHPVRLLYFPPLEFLLVWCCAMP